jgi:hypothetical protein
MGCVNGVSAQVTAKIGNCQNVRLDSPTFIIFPLRSPRIYSLKHVSFKAPLVPIIITNYKKMTLNITYCDTLDNGFIAEHFC